MHGIGNVNRWRKKEEKWDITDKNRKLRIKKKEKKMEELWNFKEKGEGRERFKTKRESEGKWWCERDRHSL